jgi:SAM-dependent methyltransferase
LTVREALELIAPAVPAVPGMWADLGAGGGTFTRALAARLGHGSKIFAVDRDGRALATLEQWAHARSSPNDPAIVTLAADLTRPFELPELAPARLDGWLLANTLHFVRHSGSVLGRLVGLLEPGGRAVIIEYEERPPSRWVPYPVTSVGLSRLLTTAGLSDPRVVARVPSIYGGTMYVMSAVR